MDIFDTDLPRLVYAITEGGGKPILVGGAVRDAVMAGYDNPFDADRDLEAMDYDIEVYGLTMPQLKNELSHRGYHFDEVGEHFAVLKVNVEGLEHPVDLSLPRVEVSTGDGHREFNVSPNPNLTFAEASRRRDFRMNSMGFDLLKGRLLDPWYGADDIKNNIICHIDDGFLEDPLRPLRAARFAARFHMDISYSTLQFCRQMLPLAHSLPSERVWMEIEKAVHEAQNLGDFFWWIEKMGWLALPFFSEIQALVDVPQDPWWHPEGDVFVHTMHALNYWSQNLRTGNKEDDLITAIAILCHDFGKATTTKLLAGRYRAHGHEEEGVPLAESFLHRLRQYELAKEVTPLVAHHLAPVHLNTPKSIRGLSTKVERMDLLCTVSRADVAGRPPIAPEGSFFTINAFEERWRSMDIPRGGPEPLVKGDFLIGLGFNPGPEFGPVLKAAYEWQLESDWTRTQLEAFAVQELYRRRTHGET